MEPEGSLPHSQASATRPYNNNNNNNNNNSNNNNNLNLIYLLLQA
jgi:hypothetical protein